MVEVGRVYKTVGGSGVRIEGYFPDHFFPYKGVDLATNLKSTWDKHGRTSDYDNTYDLVFPLVEVDVVPKDAINPDIKSLREKIRFHKDEIAKHRDQLRDMLDDIESVVDSSDEAVESLESAIDTLSRYL